MSWNLQLDRSWEREGFDTNSVATDDIEVGLSEHFALETVLIAVLTYVGGKVLDNLTDRAITKGVDAAIEKLATFAHSKQKRLRIELEERDFDPRVQLVAVKIESMDAAEFRTAIAALPALRVRVGRVLDAVSGDLTDVWYVWDAATKDWQFTYYTVAGDVIEEEPTERKSGGSESGPSTGQRSA